ncbi:hypothetical protein E2C01_010147 [Portunus trituberculatus]|uniref:Uncharacterized protein n=1 Tax=Portunus trituberculatus TaxID=210409 RepID=A0A5B7D7X1_PORTR|nr:hypothetical protein [Portunus trituberculatus]
MVSFFASRVLTIPPKHPLSSGASRSSRTEEARLLITLTKKVENIERHKRDEMKQLSTNISSVCMGLEIKFETQRERERERERYLGCIHVEVETVFLSLDCPWNTRTKLRTLGDGQRAVPDAAPWVGRLWILMKEKTVVGGVLQETLGGDV